MSDNRPALPDFTKPPVVEVALSVQFDPLEKLRTVQLGLLWSQFRETFPRTEEHAPLGPMEEKFGAGSLSHAGIRVETFDVPPVPRIWFLNEDGTQLVQVQQNRFIHNWRKVGDADKYPRYESIKEKFKVELETFCQFVKSEKLGNVILNHCEVLYVNHILAGEGWERHAQLGEVVTVWSSKYSDEFLSDPEDAGFGARFRIPGPAGEPVGRLHITLQPGLRRRDATPILVLNLTARGKPIGQDVQAAFRFLDLGREWIVRAFASVTSTRMHAIWGRCDGN